VDDDLLGRRRQAPVVAPFEQPELEQLAHVGVDVLVVPCQPIREKPDVQPIVARHVTKQFQPLLRDRGEQLPMLPKANRGTTSMPSSTRGQAAAKVRPRRNLPALRFRQAYQHFVPVPLRVPVLLTVIDVQESLACDFPATGVAVTRNDDAMLPVGPAATATA